MASTIKVKRSAVSGNAPNTSNIDAGELALNTADGILYSTDGSTVFEIGANLTSLAVSGQVTLSNIISANGGVGTAGQALFSDGSSKVYWGNVATGNPTGEKNTFYYTAGEGDTTFSGADDYSNVADLDTAYLDVFLNGILISNTNYTSNTTAVVFSSGVSNNDVITLVASTFVAGELARTYVYSANGTQTVFSGTDLNSETLSMTSNYTDVYVNGLLIWDNANNYTSNSTAVTFQSTLNENDIVTIKTYDIVPGRTGIDDNSTALAITIDASQNVGVNETTPAYNLDVGGSLGVNSLYIGDVQVTATAAEINLLDGLTANTSELNILDGVTATTAEINYLDGVTSNIQTQLDAKAPLASPAFTGTATGVNLTLSGNLTVNGTTTTSNTTNTVIADNLIELNNGVAANANDSGIVIERGTTGDNAFMGWDESADSFILGTTTATGSSTGNLTITAAPLTVSALTADGLTVSGTGVVGTFSSSNNNTVLRVKGNGATNGGGIGSTSADDLVLLSGLTERMRIDVNGKIFMNEGLPFSWTDSLLNVSAEIYGDSSDNLVFRNTSAKVERMRIDSSGHLLVGMSTDAGNTVGVRARNDGLLTATRTASHSTIFGRKSSDGDISLFQKDGTTVGSIGVNSGTIYITGAASGLIFNSGRVGASNTSGAIVDGTTDLGNTNNRFKDFYLSSGLRADTLTFSNLAGTERMRIDSSGNLLVGKTAASSATVGFQAGQDGFIAATRSSGQPLVLNRTTTDGIIADFRKDSTVVGTIGSVNGDLYVDTTDDLLLRANGNIGVGIFQSGGSLQNVTAYADFLPNGSLDLGSSGGKWVDLHLSGTVNVGEASIETATGSTSSTTQTAISTFAKATYTSGKFIIQVTDSTATEMMVTELLVVHDGTTASATQYGTIYTGSAALATFDVDISGANVRILATAASTNSMAYKVTETLIKV